MSFCNRLLILLLSVFVLTTFGCKRETFEPPEIVFARAKEAARNDDTKGFCDCLTSESQSNLAYNLAMGSILMMANVGRENEPNEINKVLKKYGVTFDKLDELEEEQEAFMPEKTPDLRGFIKDLPQFIADMDNAMVKENRGRQFRSFANVEIGNVTVNGDNAEAPAYWQVAQDDHDDERQSTTEETELLVRFKNEGRTGWKISLPRNPWPIL